MGCTQTKPLMNSPSSSSGLQKLKMDNGYVKGGPIPRRSSSISRRQNTSSDSSRDNRERRPSGRLPQSDDTYGGAVGSLSRRVSSLRLFGDEETIDGWPKWLVDNIPREALSSLIPKSADSYIKIEKVGEGTYSNVYKAREKETGKLVALKKVRFDTSEPESVKFMAREITILQKLDHPNIIKLKGIATSRMQYSLYLVFEYMYSDLSRLITRPDETLTEPQIKSYMQQLLSGLHHCHEKGILHRDIKGSNLLIDKDGMLKIADFGLANHFSTKRKRPLTNRVVTLWYRAPELLLGATDYAVGIDLWSAGCLLAEMFIGKPILPGRTEVEQLHKIFKLCGTPSEEFWKTFKVSTTFRPPREYKPSIRQTFSDFPPNVISLLNILLDLDPSFRGSAGSALQNEFFHTSPLPSELSGLPKIEIEDDDQVDVSNDLRRNSKMKQRSRTHRERRRKLEEASDKPNEDDLKMDQEKSGDSSGTKQTTNEEISDSLLGNSRIRKLSPRTEDHPNGTKNIKNRPPLPNGKARNSWREGGSNANGRRFSQVRRSVSARDMQKLEQINLIRPHHDQNEDNY
ncbi:probable serine/threonine-protein kinase At1g54610 [Impatiens glandulifera]|uniref:probable serine/threonine-protein kinase At1g54610 n=1 Tax=Impatiens glandulifera TaxID=253017 RepID=UPI001FB0CD1A|nr:probable serine/threonine-protein kinase At1g54610 [Impatiens glandulifera]